MPSWGRNGVNALANQSFLRTYLMWIYGVHKSGICKSSIVSRYPLCFCLLKPSMRCLPSGADLLSSAGPSLTFILGKTTSPTLLSCLAIPVPDLAWAIIRPGGLTWPFPALTDVRVFVLYKRARAQLPLSVRHQPPFSTDMWATIFCEYYWRSQKSEIVDFEQT